MKGQSKELNANLLKKLSSVRDLQIVKLEERRPADTKVIEWGQEEQGQDRSDRTNTNTPKWWGRGTWQHSGDCSHGQANWDQLCHQGGNWELKPGKEPKATGNLSEQSENSEQFPEPEGGQAGMGPGSSSSPLGFGRTICCLCHDLLPGYFTAPHSLAWELWVIQIWPRQFLIVRRSRVQWGHKQERHYLQVCDKCCIRLCLPIYIYLSIHQSIHPSRQDAEEGNNF